MMGKALSVSLAVAALLTTVAANAQPTLTGIVVFSTDSRGSASGGAVWDTLAGGHWNLYVIQGAPGGTFVNSGDSGTTSISIPLATGAKAFTLQGAGTAQAVIPGDSNQPVSYMGLNLFFDGDDGNPKISVFGALGVAGGTVTGGTTYALGGKTVTGANTLSFVTSVYRVTLSDFLFQPNVAGSDRVRPYKSIPDQVDDNLVTFTLTVERLPPVPGTSRWPVIAALALLTAFAGLIALRRWRAPAGSDRMPIGRLMRAIRVLQPEPIKMGFFLLLVAVAMGAWIFLSPYHFGRPSPPRLVLLYAPCTVNRRFLSPYNGAVEYTPHLDRFAARAVVFDRHQTEAAQSGVAYASLFSGTQADRHGIYKHPTKLADGVYLATEAFSGAGYETFFWSVHPMVSPALNYGQGVPATNTYTDNGSPGRFLRASDPVFRALLDGLKSDRSRRAFVMTNFMVTHGPYTAEHLVDFCHAHAQDCPVGDPVEKRKFLAAFNDHYHEWSYDFDGTKSRLGFDDADTARFIAFVEMLYKSNVWYLDSLFGALVNEIEQRDLLDESLIVFTTDHGEVLFRDNAPYKWTHGFSLAPEELEIPLIVRWPRGTQGRYGGVTRSIDVFPTLAGLSDVERNGEVDGEDLTAALLGKAQPDLLAFSHTALLPDLFMTQMNPRFPSLNKPFPRQEPQLMWVQVRQRDLVYKIANRDGSKFEAEVYDHSIDPDERGNLYDVNDPEQRDMFKKLNAYKQRLIEGYGRLKADVEGRLPTERQQEILRSLGYIP